MNLHPMSSFNDLDVFWTGSKALDLTTRQCFGVNHWVWHKDYTLVPAFEEAIGEEDDERI
jgi:hypothetical protein